MPDINPYHPSFDLADEALCLLSREPQGAPLVSLVSDLDLKQQSEVRTLFNVLRGRGIEIKTWRSPRTGLVAAVTTKSWYAAKRRAEQYADATWVPEV